MVHPDIISLEKYLGQIIDKTGTSKAVIKWGNNIAEAIDGAPGSNDRHL